MNHWRLKRLGSLVLSFSLTVAPVTALLSVMGGAAHAQTMYYDVDQKSDGTVRLKGQSRFLEVLRTPMVPTGRFIEYPRTTYETYFILKSRTNGWTEDVIIPEDQRQTIIKMNGEELHLKVRSVEPQDPIATFPVRYLDKRHLGQTVWMPVYDETIQDLSQRIVGNEQRILFGVQRLKSWLEKNIEAESDESFELRDAKDTITRGKGNYFNKSIALATMARSLGIPSRLAGGVIYYSPPELYWGVGQFRYHTWVEVYVGDEKRGEWVPVDLAQDERWADAAHIKLADSNLIYPKDPMVMAQTVAQRMQQFEVAIQEANSEGSSEVDLKGRVALAQEIIPQLNILDIDIYNTTLQSIRRFTVGRRAYDLDLKTTQGIFTNGLTQLAAGKFNEARSHFEASFERSRSALEDLYLAKRLASVEIYDLARKGFERAAKNDPRLQEEAQAWMTRVLPQAELSHHAQDVYQQGIQYLYVLKSPKQAESYFKRVLQESPQFTPAYLRLGEAQLAMGDYGQAKLAFEQYNRLLPDDPRGYAGLGQVYLQSRNYSQAIVPFKQSASLATAWNAPVGRQYQWMLENQVQVSQALAKIQANSNSISGWNDLGIALYDREQVVDAEKVFNRVLALSPGNSTALMYKSQLLLDKANWLAYEHLEPSMLSAAGGTAMARRIRGQYLLETRHYADAAQALRSAVAANPSDAKAHRFLAQAYLRQGKDAQAQAAYQRGVKQVSLDTQEGRLLAYDYANAIQKSQPTQALAVLDAILQAESQFEPAYVRKAEVLIHSGQIDEARAALFQGMLLDSTDPESLTLLAMISARNGNYPEAVNLLGRALRIEPGYPKASTMLNDLIEQENWQVPIPNVFKALTPDERNYLVQTLRDEAGFKRDTITLFKAIETFMESYGQKTLKGVVERERTTTVLNQYFDRTEGRLNRLKEMPEPPERFERFHWLFANRIYTQLGVTNVMLSTLPFTYTGKHMVNATTYVKNALKNQSRFEAAMQKELIRKRVGTQEYQAIMLEAGLSRELQKDMMAVRNAFIARLEKPVDVTQMKGLSGDSNRRSNSGGSTSTSTGDFGF